MQPRGRTGTCNLLTEPTLVFLPDIRRAAVGRHRRPAAGTQVPFLRDGGVRFFKTRFDEC